ncbi:hypothetical protein N0V88_003858 [Collariella sp. IMI 366227]|nr:hypothetical protein N0V88_003858 [Collariella sp. IMI 366227]
MSAFYKYMKPFNAACRAFGHPHETGYEELAVRCFGYVLLVDDHERAMMENFSDLDLDLNGTGDDPGLKDTWPIFLGRDGRPPPLRCIVKAFGRTEEPLRAKDSPHRQLVDGKISNFSIAITIPHFTNPELNPHLTLEWIARIEYEIFRFSVLDYWESDDMLCNWNYEQKISRKHVKTFVFPGGIGHQARYNLRRTQARERVWTLVNLIPGNWRAIVKQRRPRLSARPPRGYYDCDARLADLVRRRIECSTSLSWEYKDGFVYPRKKEYSRKAVLE